MDYRHELKFLVSTSELELIRARIEHIVKPDMHQTDQTGYLISSVYFDTFHDDCLNENIGGYDHRHKYRIRIYDHRSDLIKLERKSKIRGMTAKEAVTLSEMECRGMINGEIPLLQPEFSDTKKRILCEMKLGAMRPKCIVQYLREAFVHDVGNVRITFDKNISGSRAVDCFLDDSICTTPLLNKDVHVLEVKYDNLLPKYIAEALETGNLLQTSFSKYSYARKELSK